MIEFFFSVRGIINPAHHIFKHQWTLFFRIFTGRSTYFTVTYNLVYLSALPMHHLCKISTFSLVHVTYIKSGDYNNWFENTKWVQLHKVSRTAFGSWLTFFNDCFPPPTLSLCSFHMLSGKI